VLLLHHFEPLLRQEALHYPHASRSFFGLYRFDFILDQNLHPWLIEANQSPNLSSESTADLQNMFQRISFSLLHLMGLGSGQLRHPGNAEDHLSIIGHHSDVDIGWRICSNCTEEATGEAVGSAGGRAKSWDEVKLSGCEGHCSMCRRCRTPEQSRMIQVCSRVLQQLECLAIFAYWQGSAACQHSLDLIMHNSMICSSGTSCFKQVESDGA
jgi:hypothetical protein